MAAQTSEELAAIIIDNFMQNGIGTYENSLIYFEENDRLKTGLLAISMGAAVDEVSRLLEWQDFESLAAEILEKRGFDTSRNVVLTNPRMQIDVVGIKSGTAILIDCKHWKKMSRSSLENVAKKQIERTRQFLVKEKVQAAVPAIVTLYQQDVKFIDSTPIVPIYQLDTFCEEFYWNLDEFYSQNSA
ncbi:MAG: restriction endonuclease [Thaumarchaeota archaeon]|nr:MAG: restriction endonuclease [Nitrososphaerota archaeon]